MVRLFAAFPLPAEHASALHRFAFNSRHLQGLRVTPEANLHVTLFFIGETEASCIPEVIRELEQVFIGTSPFPIQFEAYTPAGNRTSPTMLWAKFRKSEAFTLLASRLHAAVKKYMTVNVSHPDPVPHITLARMKAGTEVSSIDFSAKPTFTGLLIDRAALWQTVRGPEGVHYETLAEFSMGA